MWRAKVFARLERTHILGRENSKSQGVAMTSDSGWGGSSRIWGRDRDARSARSYTCILSQKPRPAQRGRNCEKSLAETAAVVTHCVFLLPPVGSSRRHKEDGSTGQFSVFIGYCRSDAMVYKYRTTIIIRYNSRSKPLL